MTPLDLVRKIAHEKHDLAERLLKSEIVMTRQTGEEMLREALALRWAIQQIEEAAQRRYVEAMRR